MILQVCDVSDSKLCAELVTLSLFALAIYVLEKLQYMHFWLVVIVRFLTVVIPYCSVLKASDLPKYVLCCYPSTKTTFNMLNPMKQRSLKDSLWPPNMFCATNLELVQWNQHFEQIFSRKCPLLFIYSVYINFQRTDFNLCFMEFKNGSHFGLLLLKFTQIHLSFTVETPMKISFLES